MMLPAAKIDHGQICYRWLSCPAASFKRISRAKVHPMHLSGEPSYHLDHMLSRVYVCALLTKEEKPIRSRPALRPTFNDI